MNPLEMGPAMYLVAVPDNSPLIELNINQDYFLCVQR